MTEKTIAFDWKYYKKEALSLDAKGAFDLGLIDYTKAIDLLTQVVDDNIDKSSELACLYFSRGTCFSDAAKYAEAIVDLTKAIELCPYYPGAYNNRGNVYKSLGDYNKAISDHSQSLALSSDDGHVYFNRGTSYLHESLYAMAIPDLLHGFRLCPIYGIKIFLPLIIPLIVFIIGFIFR